MKEEIRCPVEGRMARGEQGQAAEREVGIVRIRTAPAAAKAPVGLLAAGHEPHLGVDEGRAQASHAGSQCLVQHIEIKRRAHETGACGSGNSRKTIRTRKRISS